MPSFTRPADTTAYASGDLVANSTTAGSVVPVLLIPPSASGGPRLLRRIKFAKSGTDLTGASFRIHVYSVLPTISNGDNGAWLTSGVAGAVGAMDVTVDRAFTDGAYGIALPILGTEFTIDASLPTYALVEARGAYTPVSGEIFSIDAEAPLVV